MFACLLQVEERDSLLVTFMR